MSRPNRANVLTPEPSETTQLPKIDLLKVPAEPAHSPSSCASSSDDMRRASPPLEDNDGLSRLTSPSSSDGRRTVQGVPMRLPDSRFREIYENWFDHIVKWLFAFGVPASDTEDLAQEIFLVVRRKLADFDDTNLAGWLYRITQLTVRDHRRRSWFKNLVVRRRDIDLTELSHGGESPERHYEQQENRRIFQELIAKMSEKRRTTFVLYEVEGYSGEEIAEMHDVPLGTVWTRLHHARKDFQKLVRGRRREERKAK
ncbi:MAG TPA: RNA polymerase sigma factor [Polyangia bacterium]